MSTSDVTKQGLRGVRPGRDAFTGVAAGRDVAPGMAKRRRNRGERAMVPDAEFRSYYGKPIINKPVWEAPDIPGYLFLGGLAGASSLLAAGAELTGREALARGCKVGAFGSISLSLVALVHDLGRPARFINMLRVFKPTSPMNIGSWLLSAYSPAAGVAALTAVSGRFRLVGTAATVGSAAMGGFVAAYTGALVSDTAVPAWHDGYREMPFLFVGSGATAAGGLGLIVAPLSESAPARMMASFGGATELLSDRLMHHRIGMVGEPYKKKRGGLWMRVGKLLTVAGIAGAWVGREDRVWTTASGAALIAASAATRFGVFHAGMQSSMDPKYTVVPQRERLERGQPARSD